MMNKKFLKTILFGGLFLSLTGAFVSCAEDYSDDIQNLQTQITTNSNAIAELQALLAKGVVITSVEKNAEGILLTLSDGSTQQLTNGADGKDGANGANGADGKDGQDGKDGVADVWTIGEDGYWYKNNVKTEYKAVGDKGETGAQGPQGNDGGYYEPREDGYFWYVNGDKEEKAFSWVANTMTAVQEENGVWLNNVDGKGTNIFISTVAELKSLVFKPQIIVDGVEGIIATGALVDDNINKDVENGAKPLYEIICTPEVIASYHMNPSTVKKAGIKTESLQYVAWTKEFKATRAIRNVTAEFNSIDEANGMLNVNVHFEGMPSEGNKIDIIALQVENAAGEVITSDYATVDTASLHSRDLAISRLQYITNKGDNAHYWPTIAAAKDKAINDAAVKLTADQDLRIIEVQFDQEIDLNDYVGVCLKESKLHKVFNRMTDYHLELEYSEVDFFLEGMEDGLKVTTNQAEFIVLTGSKVMPCTYSEDGVERSSIGRTPIIRAQLVHKENGKRTVLETRYVVLEIVSDVKPVTVAEYPISEGIVFDYTFCSAQPEEIKAEQMNHVYFSEKISKEEFAANYKFLTWNDGAVVIGGKPYRTSQNVSYSANAGQVTTYGLTWTLSPYYIWTMAGKYPEPAYAVYERNDKKHYVVLKLEAEKPFAPREIVKFPEGGVKFEEMWTDNLSLGMFNVRVPFVGENNTKQCTFINDIRTLYLENQDPATLVEKAVKASGYKVSTATGVSDVTVEYVFASAKCDTLNYKETNFKIKNDGKELWYTDDHLIATLDGTIVTLNDNHDKNTMAEELLNTNKLVVTYAVKAEFEFCHGILDVPADRKVTFDVRYVRPLNVLATANDYFQDGNDFGAEHTIIKAADVVRLQDWRGEKVSLSNADPYNGYYGVEEAITVSKVTCNTKQFTTPQPLPQTIKAGIINDAAKKDPANADIASILAKYNDYEYFYYYNNGTVLQEDIEINFVVTVKYWWGELKTRTVTVPVKKTNNINKVGLQK